MNKKILAVLACSAILTGLTACGTSEKTDKKEDVKTSESKETKTDKKEATNTNKETTKEVRKSEYGTLTVIKKNVSLGISETVGPFKLDVNKVQIAKLDVNPNFKETFQGKDKATVVTIEMNVENTSDDTNSFYPDQAQLVTNDGEQKEASLFMSDKVGGDFIGKVKKKGNVIFLLDGDPEKINHLKIVIDGPHNKNFEAIGEEKTIEFDIK